MATDAELRALEASLRLMVGNLTAPVGDEKLDPSTQSADYDAMLPYWNMVDTILGGKQAMQDANETYLYRFQEEASDSRDSRNRTYDPYTLRLNKTPFTNLYDDILKNLSSKPFAKELTLKEGTPDQFKKLGENVDGQGNNLHVFCQNVFRSALNHAIAYILVDYTRAQPRADGQPLSRADEAAQNLRPYWCFIPATRMLAIYSDYDGGQEIITHARIFEPAITLQGFQEVAVERIRVLEREVLERDGAGKAIKWGAATYMLWEKLTPTPENPKGLWQLVDAGVYTVGIIPLVPVVLTERRQGSYRAEPALHNLAYMQIAEYNQESNVMGVSDATCFPMFVCVGLEKKKGDDNLAVGPRSVIMIPPPASGSAGDFKSIEPSGASVRVIMDQLKEIRTEMRDLGMQPLTQSNLTVITTGQVAVKANSAVQAWAIRFKDAVEQAWKITAEWLGLALEPEIVIHTDYSAAMDEGKGFEGVMKLRTNKDVSRETAIGAAQRYGYLPDDFDIQADEEQLAKEQADASSLMGEVQIDPRTGKPIPPLGQAAQSGQQQQPPRANGGLPIQ